MNENINPDETTAEIDPLSEIQYRAFLKRGRERSIIRRHPWIFSGAIDKLESTETAKPGDLAQILTSSEKLLGTAIFNPGSQLTGRVLRLDDGPIDQAFFEMVMQRAARLRAETISPDTNAYRLINAEGDGLPGLIVDRYADYLVVQVVALGMSRLESLWLKALVKTFSPKGIIDRSERSRHDSNMTRTDGCLWGEDAPPRIEISENGHTFLVDMVAGQKTGYYLDQRENRQRVGQIASGKRVLNAFSYTGGFGIYAGFGGASEVVMVETSSTALGIAGDTWKANDLNPDRLTIVRESVQDYLRRETEKFDIIILDPPPFARERKYAEQASRAYKDVNLWAMKRLNPGGYLATFSCSQHIGVTLFQQIIFGASLDAEVPCQWLTRLCPGSDHPVHLDHPQGEYLKGLLLRNMVTE